MKTLMDTDDASQKEAGSSPHSMTVDFQVQPLHRHGNQIACAITGGAVNGGVIELRKDHGHMMTFQLVPGSVAGLSFVAAADVPFCSVVDDCPKKGDQVGQFTKMVVSADGQTLTVAADPGTDPIVHYALRFTDGGAKALTWDPIIINH